MSRRRNRLLLRIARPRREKLGGLDFAVGPFRYHQHPRLPLEPARFPSREITCQYRALPSRAE